MECDYLRRFRFEGLPVRGSFVRLGFSLREVWARSAPDPRVSGLLSETLCASVLLNSYIKFKGSVSLQVQSSGSVKYLLGQCNHRLQIRGVARFDESRSTLFEDPVLSINLRPVDKGVPYQGIVEMSPQGLKEPIERYFAQSEQMDTRIWLSRGKGMCVGMMLQRIPGKGTDTDDWERIVEAVADLSDQQLVELDPVTLLRLKFGDETIRLFKSYPVTFGCSCSRQRVAEMLQGLGERSAREILEEEPCIEVRCDFCGASYRFDAVDITVLFTTDGIQPDSSRNLQ